LTHPCWRISPDTNLTEYRNKVLTRLAFNNPRWGCYALAVTIFSLGILRDHLYQRALAEQPQLPLLHYTEFKLLAMVLFAIGGTLVVTSMWALGVTGTYLGDYFVSASLPLVPLKIRSRSHGLHGFTRSWPLFRCTGHSHGRELHFLTFWELSRDATQSILLADRRSRVLLV
jgi:hypothetical protein